MALSEPMRSSDTGSSDGMLSVSWLTAMSIGTLAMYRCRCAANAASATTHALAPSNALAAGTAAAAHDVCKLRGSDTTTDCTVVQCMLDTDTPRPVLCYAFQHSKQGGQEA